MGEIGCFCSHKKIWDDIVKHGYKNVLILEDDIVLTDHFEERLAMAIERASINYDLIYLGWYGDRGQCDINYNDLLLAKATGSVLSTESYILTQKAAKNLLANTTMNKQVDEEMADLIEVGKLNAYVIKVKLTHQSKNIKSVINGG